MTPTSPQPSRIDHPEIVNAALNLVKIDPISRAALWATLSHDEQHTLMKTNPEVRDLVRHDLIRKIKKSDQETYRVNLKKLMDLFTPTPAIPGHTLNMKVQGREIYRLLPILQVELSKRLSEVRTDRFVGRENEFDEKLEGYLANIDTIKIHMPQPLASEKNKNPRNKTIIRGSEQGYSNNAGVDGIVLCRNEEYNWGSEKKMKNFENKVDAIIDGMMSDFDLSQREAVEIIFLRKGWGLYGWQDSGGEFYGVGEYGRFTFSPLDGEFYGVGEYGRFTFSPLDNRGPVRYLYLLKSDAGRDRGGQKEARTVARD